MRILLALLVTAFSVVSVDADIRFRRANGNRITPFRNWRAWNGYNTRFPGYDSSYYTPYSTTNTSNSVLENGSSMTMPGNTSQTLDPIPTWQPQPFPQSNELRHTINPSQPTTETTNSTTTRTIPKNSIRKSTPTNYQMPQNGSSYWDGLEKGP